MAGSVLAGLLPLALIIAISPLSVIPAVLVLQAPRPRPTSLAFLGGWLLGLAALTAAFIAGSGPLSTLHRSEPSWAWWVRVVIGASLVSLGIYLWLTRHGRTHSPAWMRSFTTITPLRAGLTGLALTVVRVEVLVMCMSAGLAIGTSPLGTVDQWISALFFVAVAASTVAVPVLAYAEAGPRLDNALARLKTWMEQNHAALMAGVLVFIGVMLLHNGLHAL